MCIVILEKTIRIPRSISVKAGSVLKGFLNKNPNERLGCHPQTGFADIMEHPFFRPVDWELVEQRQVTPPYRPCGDDLRDVTNFDPQFTSEAVDFTQDDRLISFIPIHIRFQYELCLVGKLLMLLTSLSLKDLNMSTPC
jgi:atypical protein kinase C iota type